MGDCESNKGISKRVRHPLYMLGLVTYFYINSSVTLVIIVLHKFQVYNKRIQQFHTLFSAYYDM